MIVLYVASINMCNVIVHGDEYNLHVDVILACYSPNNAHSSHLKLCLSQIDMEG